MAFDTQASSLFIFEITDYNTKKFQNRNKYNKLTGRLQPLASCATSVTHPTGYGRA
jgi:hypothetical protein